MTVGNEKDDKIISEFLKSIGPWREHIAIGGGYAPIIYKLYFDQQKSGHLPVATRDLDSLIHRKIPIASKKDIAAHLKESGFKQIFKDNANPATEAYVREIDGDEVEIEFLTDDLTRGDKDKNVVIAGVVAQPLSYLNLSLQKTNRFKTRTGEMGRVVSPGAWIFHKGLTFTRRKVGESKRFKDLYGIWYVAGQLGEVSRRSIEELRTFASEHSSWFQTFQNNLRSWIEDASPADWSKLEAQDPFGDLKKAGFADLIQRLVS